MPQLEEPALVELPHVRSAPSTGSSAPSLTSVSASSAARIGVAHDADARVAARDRAAQQRAAQRDAELAVLVRVRPPDRPGVPAAVEALERRDQRRGDGERLAADGGRRVQQPRQPHRADRLAQLRADRGREVLDVRHLHDRPAPAPRRPTRCAARSARSIRRDDDRLLARGPCRSAAAARRGGRRRTGRRCARVEPASASVVARIPSRRMSSSGLAATNAPSPRPTQKHEAGREPLAQDAEDRGGVVRRGRVDLHLAREHDLLERARADALDRARDRALVVLGRHASLATA